MNNDLISRKAAIDELKEHRALYCDNTPDTFLKLSYAEKSRVDELDTAIATLVNLPSAQPERKNGEWIKKISKKIKDKEYIGYTPYWYCSECGKRYEPAIANTIINYCYNCGAKMEG